ncbi:sugar phosphate isomerase/epimerase family protein [Saccharopolyspora flava]|uniref:Sugar phosphate isomerase/epimerase n=1 Tax=Saccharopolyspora flava TaxID=95161 RepID=A0A1I6V2I4_9PSEU|nr:TIM barrel protein [Saccharopolyspora flava]SFT07884.1 Sugar phosphate isomerase/epimerase [Saccharopolyspora flava]
MSEQTRASAIRRGVSLYSFQEEYFLRTMSVEDCVAACARMGALGIEIIPEQSIPGFPVLTEEFLDSWRGWMNTYGTTPVATNAFLDTKLHPDRWLTLDEQVASVHRDIDIAVALGAGIVKATINFPPEVMEAAAPHAEERGVRILLEVHAPFHYRHPWVVEHLEVMHRVGAHVLGLMPDMGIHVRRFPRVVSERALRDGAKPELVDYIVRTYDDGGDTHALMDVVNYRGGGPVEFGLARQATHYIWSEPKDMLEHMAFIGHVQAKFYEMPDEHAEFSIPYDEIVPVLADGGFTGYLSSEYEGNRHIQDAHPVDSVEQVARQQRMLARLLGETA